MLRTLLHSRKCLAAFVLLFAPMALAADIDYSSEISVEIRAFVEDSDSATQGNGIEPSIAFEPEWRWRSEDRKQRVSAILFARVDEQDNERSHADVRELYWARRMEAGWSVLVGLNKVFWGVTESRHLVDIINQTDLVEDIDQEDKLGQPMIQLGKQTDWGKFELFVLPLFRERTFPGKEGRFGFGFDVSDQAIYESKAEDTHIDWSLRYSHYIGDVDVGLHWFKGTDREPRLIFNADSNQLDPFYQQIEQIGVDLQYTIDAWLWKWESVYRESTVDDFAALVAGFEYTFYQVNDSAADLGLLLEYQYDDRNAQSPITLADDDIFVGARYAFNDGGDSSILAGLSYDLNSDATFINIEAETRIKNNLTLEVRARAFTNIDPSDPAFAFSQNDYVQIRLGWHF